MLLMLVALTPTGALALEAYPDGIYRGSYYDGGIEQIAIQFELQGGVFTSIVYRGVRYSDGDYLSEDASDVQKAIVNQYHQLAEHLIGKGIDAIGDLYQPYAIVEDYDAVTTATIQASKLISALWDGLNRRPYKLTESATLPQPPTFADGVYRGCYMEDGGEQVALEFTLRDNRFAELRYRALEYGGASYLAEDAPEGVRVVAAQFQALLDYLTGKPVSAVNDLYQPSDVLPDAIGGATIRSPKVISAIWDALNRHAYILD